MPTRFRQPLARRRVGTLRFAHPHLQRRPACIFPSIRRSCRCSPSAVGELPTGEGWIFEPKWDGFRALVFRDGDEVFIQSRDEKPLDRYYPSSSSRSRRSCPERCVLDGEIVIVRTRRARLRGAAAPASSGGVAGEVAVQGNPCLVRVLRSAVRGRSRPARRCRSRSGAPRSRPCSPGEAAAPPDAVDARPGGRRRLVRALRGRRPRRRDGEAGVGHLRAQQARHAQGEARARMRLRRRRVSAGTRAARASPSDRCSSGSTTRPAACSMSASARASPTPSAASWSSFLAPYRPTRSKGIRGRTGRDADKPTARAAPAGSGEPLEPGQGSVMAAAPPGAGRRGGLRPHAGDALPPHRAVPPLAPGQAAAATAPSPSSKSSRRTSWRRSSRRGGRVRLRRARVGGARAPCPCGFATRSRDALAQRWRLRPPYAVPLPRFAGEAFLDSSRHSRVGSSSGSGVSCGGRSGFRDVAEVHADAGPGRGAAAHAIDQHIVDGEVLGRLGVLRLPALEAGEGGLPGRASWRP